MKKIILIGCIILSLQLYSQGLVGINTKSPLTKLHIVSATSDTWQNGLILPSWENGTTVTSLTGRRESQLGYWKQKGFYYWNNSKFVPLATKLPDRNYAFNIYAFTGENFQHIESSPPSTLFKRYYAERKVMFTNRYSTNNDNFNLNDGTVTIGKTGNYYISLHLSLLRTPLAEHMVENVTDTINADIAYLPSQQNLYEGRQWRKFKKYNEQGETVNYRVAIKHVNGNVLIESWITHSTEKKAGANIVINKIYKLNQNDQIYCVIQRLPPVGSTYLTPPIYQSLGTNALILTYVSE